MQVHMFGSVLALFFSQVLHNYCVLFMTCVRHSHHPLHFLSTVLKWNVPTYVVPFWRGAVGGREAAEVKQPTQPTQQIPITWCAHGRQSYRVRNWHVAQVQLRIALVRCPRCNEIQL